MGLQAEDPTIAELLKNHGYATGQFGKNHLGDRNEYLPTGHGFDEFLGNLDHLNAEEEPELPDYPSPKDFPGFIKQFGPRGVLHCYATDQDDATVHERFGRVGKQKIKDTGPLTKKRMETCDDEFAAAAKDKNVGEVLNLLDELKIADNTIVMYTTDNGPHMNTWPDGAMTPFRSEKDTNWEGAFRVPLLLRWPGKIAAGSVSNEIVQHHDWLPTFLAAAGESDVKEKLLKGHRAAGKTFKVHIDGYNLLPYLTGKEKKSPRQGLIYFDDDGNLVALRYANRSV